MIGQAFAIGSARAHLPPVTAVESSLGGSRIHIGMRAKPTAWSPSALKREIASAAKGQDASVTILRVADLNGRPVTRLRLRVYDPARFLAQRLSLVLAALPDFEAGHFVEVTDAGGYLALLAAGGSGWGMGGSAQALESCGPAAPSYPIGYEPRPCPFTGAHVYAQPGARPYRSASKVAATAAALARGGEKVRFLVAAPTASELCRSCRIAHCPNVAGTTWVATLTKGSGRETADRWVMIDDAAGRVVASGLTA
jgi:hypothetical protein